MKNQAGVAELDSYLEDTQNGHQAQTQKHRGVYRVSLQLNMTSNIFRNLGYVFFKAPCNQIIDC